MANILEFVQIISSSITNIREGLGGGFGGGEGGSPRDMFEKAGGQT